MRVVGTIILICIVLTGCSRSKPLNIPEAKQELIKHFHIYTGEQSKSYTLTVEAKTKSKDIDSYLTRDQTLINSGKDSNWYLNLNGQILDFQTNSILQLSGSLEYYQNITGLFIDINNIFVNIGTGHYETKRINTILKEIQQQAILIDTPEEKNKIQKHIFARWDILELQHNLYTLLLDNETSRYIDTGSDIAQLTLAVSLSQERRRKLTPILWLTGETNLLSENTQISYEKNVPTIYITLSNTWTQLSGTLTPNQSIITLTYKQITHTFIYKDNTFSLFNDNKEEIAIIKCRKKKNTSICSGNIRLQLGPKNAVQKQEDIISIQAKITQDTRSSIEIIPPNSYRRLSDILNNPISL